MVFYGAAQPRVRLDSDLLTQLREMKAMLSMILKLQKLAGSSKTVVT